MKDLSLKQQQPEYFRVMEKRIRYYANKYDPYTIIEDPTFKSENEPEVERRQKFRINTLRTFFLNIF